MEITGYGGVGEIGGNAFLLREGNTRLVLDLGTRFGAGDLGPKPGFFDLFSEFVQPRTRVAVQDLHALDLLPDLPGAWRRDMGGHEGPGIDGVVVSHAHADHVGLLNFLESDVPILTNPLTWHSMQAFDEAGHLDQSHQLTRFAPLADRYETKTGKWSTMRRSEVVNRPFHDLTGKTEVGGMVMEQFPVDHSLLGAHGTRIEGASGTVAYTGDLRLHGRARRDTEAFFQAVAGCDLLLAEGTRISRSSKREEGPQTEEDVRRVLADAVHAFEGRGGSFVAIAYPWKDLDRMRSIVEVAKETNRILLITPRQASLLDALRKEDPSLPDPGSDPQVRVLYRAKGRPEILNGRVERLHADGSREWMDAETGVPKDVAAWPNHWISIQEVRKQTEGYLYPLDDFTIQDLLDLFPEERPGGLFLSSKTEPFNDSLEMQDQKLERWLRHFHLERVQCHVSGHIDPESHAWMLEEIGARTYLPIHTMAPEKSVAWYNEHTPHRAELLQFGKPFVG